MYVQLDPFASSRSNISPENRNQNTVGGRVGVVVKQDNRRAAPKKASRLPIPPQPPNATQRHHRPARARPERLSSLAVRCAAVPCLGLRARVSPAASSRIKRGKLESLSKKVGSWSLRWTIVDPCRWQCWEEACWEGGSRNQGIVLRFRVCGRRKALGYLIRRSRTWEQSGEIW